MKYTKHRLVKLVQERKGIKEYPEARELVDSWSYKKRSCYWANYKKERRETILGWITVFLFAAIIFYLLIGNDMVDNYKQEKAQSKMQEEMPVNWTYKGIKGYDIKYGDTVYSFAYEIDKEYNDVNLSVKDWYYVLRSINNLDKYTVNHIEAGGKIYVPVLEKEVY